MKFYLAVLFIFSMFIVNGCKENAPLIPPAETPTKVDQLSVPEGFSYATTQQKVLHITTGLRERQVAISIYDADPENGGKKIATFSTLNGEVNSLIDIPAGLDTVYAVTNYIGLQNVIPVAVTTADLRIYYEPMSNENYLTGSPGKPSEINAIYKTLGTWSYLGVPNYLQPVRDVIPQSLLDKLNTSLPEKSPLTSTHPEYLDNNAKTNIVLTDSSEVFVTFVHEGAGYRNVFGFYTYPLDSPPQSIADIQSTMTIIFPNVSYNQSGGGLYSGDKVKIGNFSANTVIGWFLLSNGYVPPNVTDGAWRLFSDRNLNPEVNPDKRQHMVALHDAGNERIVLGFEDINRENAGCDQDFNDAMFYVSANPFTAINTSSMQLMDIPQNFDRDNDGVDNNQDEFPDDPTRAFVNEYPAEGVNGTLAFEDLWPSKGDYDFNDLVVQYHYRVITNSQNKAVEMDGTYTVTAIGAGYKNGFGIATNLPQEDIASVTGHKLFNGFINLRGNGTEAGNSKAVIIVFDDAHQVMGAGGNFVNTTDNGIYQAPVSVPIHIVFNRPVELSELGTMPFNPFLIVNKERGKEVHLPNQKPTELANAALFGTIDDNSNSSGGKYYLTKKNLPWALHIPISFEYPKEKSEILSAYPNFGVWAESFGIVKPRWYSDEAGNKITGHIYRKQ